MPEHFQSLWNQILHWTESYGYHAVVPTLLADPAGVPWAWIFLMMIAEEAHLNVFLMMAYGCGVLSAWDHALYWIGITGGRPLVEKLVQRWPKLGRSIEGAEQAMQGKGIWAVTFGRYLPLVGRWITLAAGLTKTSYARFAIFDAIGVTLTVVGFGVASHLVGRSLISQPWFPKALVVTFIVSTVVTTLLVVLQAWLFRKRKGAVAEAAPSSPQ